MADAPYLSMQRFPGNGTTTDWTVNFAGNTPSNENWYIEADDIEAIEVVPATALTAEVRIARTVTRIGPSQFRVTPAVASGRILVLRRKTENRFNLVDFQSLQAVSEYDLDLANKQLLFVTQEASDQARLAEERSFEAETIAYSSVNDAAVALATSQDARNRAINAQTAAGSAQTAAANAVSTANSANTTASAANTTANAANSTANTALTTANAADAKANQAISTANSATATANGASNVALAASADAAAALDAAEQAELAASSAQTISQAAQTAATDAVNTANAAATTANAVDGKAQEALDNSTYATSRADLAMSLVEEAGVSTFNGRAGVVVPKAGDYTAAQISHGTDSNVEEALQDLSDYDTVLQQHITSEVNRVSTDFSNQLNSIDQAKLDKSGNAATANRAGVLNWTNYGGGQGVGNGSHVIFDASNSVSPSGKAVNNIDPEAAWASTHPTLMGWNGINTYGVRVDRARSAEALTSNITINGVAANVGSNITVADATKMPLAGGTFTGTVFTRDSGINSGHVGGSSAFQVMGSASTGAVFTLHRVNAYALNIGLDTDNVFRIGGWNDGGTHRMHLDPAGNFTARGNVTAYSDIRLKTDIQVIPDALDKVCALRGVTYERIDTGERQTGVIAQEVQAVLPEAVMDVGEHLSVAYGNMVGLLIEAVKELAAKVKELEDASTK